MNWAWTPVRENSACSRIVGLYDTSLCLPVTLWMLTSGFISAAIKWTLFLFLFFSQCIYKNKQETSWRLMTLTVQIRRCICDVVPQRRHVKFGQPSGFLHYHMRHEIPDNLPRIQHDHVIVDAIAPAQQVLVHHTKLDLFSWRQRHVHLKRVHFPVPGRVILTSDSCSVEKGDFLRSVPLVWEKWLTRGVLFWEAGWCWISLLVSGSLFRVALQLPLHRSFRPALWKHNYCIDIVQGAF